MKKTIYKKNNGQREVKAIARAKNNGVKNLIPVNKRTKEEQKQIASKGGKASGEARRRRRDTRRAARFVLELEPDVSEKVRVSLSKMGLQEDEIPDIRLLSLLAIAQKAMKGDLQANRMLLELAGDVDARLKIEQDRLKLDREKLEFEMQKGGSVTDDVPQIIIERTVQPDTSEAGGDCDAGSIEDK